MTLATIAEADAEWARNVGADRPEQAWILSDRDVWYRNPAYSGPPEPHPEDCAWEWYDEDEDQPCDPNPLHDAHVYAWRRSFLVIALDDNDDDIPF